MTKEEISNIISFYLSHDKLKKKTCEKFNLPRPMLNQILKEEGYA